MEIHFHAIDFAVVETDQQKYYDEKTKNFFKSQKKLRQLFEEVSNFILRRGSGFTLDMNNYPLSRPLPEYQDYLLILDYPKSYFKDILLKLRFLLEEIQDDWHFNNAVDPEITMPLYRNIKHLMVVVAYKANIIDVCL